MRCGEGSAAQRLQQLDVTAREARSVRRGGEVSAGEEEVVGLAPLLRFLLQGGGALLGYILV